MRVTRLDGCGRVAPAACSSVVSDGFVSIALTANINTGTDISVENAAGRVCVSDPAVPQFNGYGVVVTFCQVDPELYAMMSGQATVFDGAGDAVGFRVSSDVDSSDSGFALEVWSNVPAAACSAEAGQGTYGYTLLPFVQGGVLGDFTIENGAVTFTVSNAATKTGSGWDTGPYDVVLDDADAASPLLTAIGTSDHLHVQLTEVAPPEPTTDCVASGPRSTSGIAGIPGTYGPTDSYPRESFADLTVSPTLTASPTTAWTTGQYILLADGTKAHWTSSAWAAGPA
jgi:hypothetical protein